MGKNHFSIRRRLGSFKYAINGLLLLIREEHNSRIHFFAGIMAILLGWLLEINSVEWMIICGVIGFVFAMELINSAIENLCDLVSPEKNDLVKKAKDQAAGAVLVSAIVALVCGLFIFIPKLLVFFRGQ
ncbi:diacylglycerol kinase [Fulvitalea axinellae]|uniref:Diacylglycerol kinase n=1 Tax=Fulvitalea axinellae TaxID=1182444 RepID=A0AAU9CHP9_9BACT|nr:diacylglycerol kinase [Fulvitalea axinellae]